MRATGASPLRSVTRVTEKAKTARSPAARSNSATELFMRGSNKSGASSPEGHGRGIRRLLDLAGCVKKYRASLSCVGMLTRIGCVYAFHAGAGEEDRGSVSDSEVRKGDGRGRKRRDGGGDEGNEQMIPPMTVFMPKTSAERISVLVCPLSSFIHPCSLQTVSADSIYTCS